MKKIKVALSSKNEDKIYQGVLIKEFDTLFLIVNFETCVQKVELSEYEFNTLFDESYIDFLNRVLY